MNKSFYRTILAECGDEQNIYSLCKSSCTVGNIWSQRKTQDKSDWASILNDAQAFLDSQPAKYTNIYLLGGFLLFVGTDPKIDGKSVRRAFLEWAAENAAD